ncbi:hypothetical protein Hdeb2414_s0007g00232471 [Helianthus debilis subsp. tardiflorus]
MEEKEYEFYITTDWNRIKKEMSITNDHLVVFEMVDLQTFNMTVFKCAPFFLVYPPELCVAMKEEPNHEVIKLSDDEVADQIAELNVN